MERQSSTFCLGFVTNYLESVLETSVYGLGQVWLGQLGTYIYTLRVSETQVGLVVVYWFQGVGYVQSVDGSLTSAHSATRIPNYTKQNMCRCTVLKAISNFYLFFSSSHLVDPPISTPNTPFFRYPLYLKKCLAKRKTFFRKLLSFFFF